MDFLPKVIELGPEGRIVVDSEGGKLVLMVEYKGADGAIMLKGEVGIGEILKGLAAKSDNKIDDKLAEYVGKFLE